MTQGTAENDVRTRWVEGLWKGIKDDENVTVGRGDLQAGYDFGWACDDRECNTMRICCE